MTDPSSPTQHEDFQEVENYLETYSAIGEWIRFADAKSVAVLTVIAALSGLLIPTLKTYLDAKPNEGHPTSWWSILIVILFVIWLALQAVSGLYAFACITPFRRRGRHPAIDHARHFHPAGISHHYTLDEHERFVTEFIQVGPHGFKREVMIAILIDAHVSNKKYAYVSRSIRLLGVSTIFALLYFLAIQF
jgi:hypothetical protein